MDREPAAQLNVVLDWVAQLAERLERGERVREGYLRARRIAGKVDGQIRMAADWAALRAASTAERSDPR